MNPVNFIDGIAGGLHLPPVVVGTWIAMGILIIFGLLARNALTASADPTVPESGIMLRSVGEVLAEWLDGFVAGVLNRPGWLLERRGCRIFAWVACIVLILVHGPGAVAKRIVVVKANAIGFAWAGRVPPTWPNIENENVIIVNHPISLESYYVPAYGAYDHQPLPKTLRVLTPACTGFDVQRTDDKTLVIRSKGPDIFSCDDVGPVHIAYAFNMCDRVLLENPQYKKGDRYQLKGLTVEILELDASDLPSRVAFHFDASLDSPHFRWLWFDWRTASTEPFKVPAIGQSVTLPGPRKLRFGI